MSNQYHNVSGETLNNGFYGLVPCPCFAKGSSIDQHHYNVKLILGTNSYEKRGNVIKRIIVDCQLCKHHEVFDNLEDMQVCVNDIWWN